ncbi:hypothetical protein NPIL_645191 [Nephila pilipes]|uniref:Uncharacterized protein n=1 Tax=Nephila pilipes TaxID=299642 RepID=A0A8X6PAY1_NEPPI|nr:hypothetical protein NPIL_645191 [Nephila pilipes]
MGDNNCSYVNDFVQSENICRRNRPAIFLDLNPICNPWDYRCWSGTTTQNAEQFTITNDLRTALLEERNKLNYDILNGLIMSTSYRNYLVFPHVTTLLLNV